MLDIFFFRKSVLHRKTTNATKALAQIVSDVPALLIVTSCQRSAIELYRTANVSSNPVAINEQKRWVETP